jgi:hypothetical protein
MIRDGNSLEVRPNKTVTLPKRAKVTKFVGDILAGSIRRDVKLNEIFPEENKQESPRAKERGEW